jgi:pimeloyl-ACP methyl ester carboxylesterase
LLEAPGLAAEEHGAGPPVVLVHGALGDYRQWSPIAAALATDCRVVAISRRYHWPNPPPAKDVIYSYESHADDLAVLLRRFEQRIHLVGHSYGAGVALVAALAAPELVRSLVLIEPAFGSVLSQPAAELQPEIESRNAAMAAVQALAGAGDDEGASETLIDWVQGGTGGFGRLPDQAKRVLLDNASTIGPTFRVAARNVTRDQLAAFRAPVLVLNGERTRVWYRLIGKTVAASIPGAEAATIPASSHMAIVENPSATAALLGAFLSRH